MSHMRIRLRLSPSPSPSLSPSLSRPLPLPLPLLVVLVVLAMLPLVGCGARSSPGVASAADPASSEEIARLIARLNNADIEWEGTYFGLMPRVRGAAAQRL